jgi:nucleoside recognition membrane protein YjiH
MSNKAFHLYNIIVLLLLLVVNYLPFLAFSISEGEWKVSQWIAIGIPFMFWGIVYFVQFARSNKVWRVCWLCMMVVFLFFWYTGFGGTVARMFD